MDQSSGQTTASARHNKRRRNRSKAPHRSGSRKPPKNRKKKAPTMGKSKNRIPDNWVDVAKMGTLVGTSRFAPLRVPLDDSFLPQFESKREELWTPHDFLALQHDQNYNVKMIIDLTNTFKYYNGEKEFRNSGVQYKKLQIEGFYGPPEAQEVKKFVKLVDDFIAKTPEGTIAVHCTHGLNRTGYLVVTYMVKRLKYSVTDALAAFKAARPPGLIKHMYVEDLYKQLGPDEKVQLPELPAWASAKYSTKMAQYSTKGVQYSTKEAKGGGQAPAKRSKQKKRSKTKLPSVEAGALAAAAATGVGTPKV